MQTAGLKPAVKALSGYDRSPHVRTIVRGARTRARQLRYGGTSRYCPCCRSHLRTFKPFGLVPRPDALCPVCHSLDRHRLILLYVTERTALFDERRKRMLHIAPEPQLAQLFQRAPSIDYLSGDLDGSRAMETIDVMDIHHEDSSFDVIYCSHVLEHVPDDRRAMRELYRVLAPGGWAILQVPIDGDRTYEDPTVEDPRERERLFGQDNHLRRYGPDYADRLREAGFSVSVDDFVRKLPDRTVTRVGLVRTEDVYLCRKAS
jgi:SAM-dependent methyltransferase